MYEDGDILGFVSCIDKQEFGEFNKILTQVDFMGEKWIVYAKYYLYDKELMFDKIYCGKEKKFSVRCRRRNGTFVNHGKNYFEEKKYRVVKK